MTTKNALLSVYDKTGVVEFAQELIGLGWKIYSSGGTAKAIAAADLPVTDVAELTGVPAILGHRVVTLHPRVHGGILGIPDNPEHQRDMAEYDIEPFGLVVVNLYPFASNPSIDLIDVGGPAMVRGAAKNHSHVGVVTDPNDYWGVLTELEQCGSLSDKTRRQLAIKAFAHTAEYDQCIVEWLSNGEYTGWLGQKVRDCGYGENRWQSPAALYRQVGTTDPLAIDKFEIVAGQNPGFVNLTDVDRLLQTVTHLVAEHEINLDEAPYVAVAVKHGNACGAATADTPEQALKLMLMGDPKAVFGAVVMTNFAITGELADLLLHYKTSVRRLLDGICAPSFDKAALQGLGRRDGKYFLAVNPALAELTAESLDTRLLVRPVRGGFLTEPNYANVKPGDDVIIWGDGDLPVRQARDLATGIAICATSNSNTITLVKDGQLIGNGVGQQDRVGAAKLALERAWQAGHDTRGATAVSDSFFPFTDGPQVLIDGGITTIFSTTGSKRDGEVQQLCIDNGVTLVQVSDAEGRMFYRH